MLCKQFIEKIGGKMYQSLKNEGVTAVYHFTDEANLQSIKDNGGIFSLNKIKEKGIAGISYISNYWSKNADIYKSLDTFVHLCFAKQHPMAYNAKEKGKNLIWLEIDTIILKNIDGVLYTNDVSNKSGVHLLDNDEAKCVLDIKAITKFLPFDCGNNQERKIATYKYEILIPDCVSLEYIKNI